MAYRRWLDPACEITGGPRLSQKTTLIVYRRRVGDHKSSSEGHGPGRNRSIECAIAR
jgi:hypothetical protein